MSLPLPTADATCKVPSTKAWLLLLGLLSGLLLVARQLPIISVSASPTMVGGTALPPRRPPLTAQRVALETPARQPSSTATAATTL